MVPFFEVRSDGFHRDCGARHLDREISVDPIAEGLSAGAIADIRWPGVGPMDFGGQRHLV
jgi:hypothetical protein